MRKLADISQFESIANSAMAVQNGFMQDGFKKTKKALLPLLLAGSALGGLGGLKYAQSKRDPQFFKDNKEYNSGYSSTRQDRVDEDPLLHDIEVERKDYAEAAKQAGLTPQTDPLKEIFTHAYGPRNPEWTPGNESPYYNEPLYYYPKKGKYRGTLPEEGFFRKAVNTITGNSPRLIAPAGVLKDPNNPLLDDVLKGAMKMIHYDAPLYRLNRNTDPLGRAYAKARLFRPAPGNQNYEAARVAWDQKKEELEQSELLFPLFYHNSDVEEQSSRKREVFKNNLRNAYELVGRFCANFDLDLTDEIKNVKIKRDLDDEDERAYAIDNTIHVGYDNSATDIAHEMLHAILGDNEAISNVISKPGYLMGQFADDAYGDADLPYNALRGFYAGNPYAGKIYDIIYKTPLGALDRGKYYRAKRNKGESQENLDSEYFTTFVSGLGNDIDTKIPLAYALDMQHTIKKINKEAARLGIAYSQNHPEIKDQLTSTAKEMLLQGVRSKTPWVPLLKAVGNKLDHVVQSYLDKDALETYRKIEDGKR